MTKKKRSLLKIGELARETGCPVSTIRHYINEGLIDSPCVESKNMAYYPREAIPKVSLAKRLQTELFLPLKLIKKLVRPQKALTFEEYSLSVEVRNRLQQASDLLPEMCSIPASEILNHLELTKDELLTLEKLGIVSPETNNGQRYYNELDFKILKSYSECRRSGFSADLGFAAEDAAVYAGIIRDLVKTEWRWFVERMAAHLSANEVVDVLRKGLPALNDLLASLHHKFIVEMLEEMLSRKERPGSL